MTDLGLLVNIDFINCHIRFRKYGFTFGQYVFYDVSICDILTYFGNRKQTYLLRKVLE